MTAHILLIENSNLDRSESLASNLESLGFQAITAHTPQGAVQRLETLWPNLVVFNPTRGSLDLPTVQQAIRDTDLEIPCIIVSSENHLLTDGNSEAIVIKPDDPEQLTESIKKVISKQEDRFIRLPNLILDRQLHQVLRDQKRFSLTPKEFKLLHLLIANHDQVLSRKTIMQKVWETDYMGDTRTLDVHIRWLREKIEASPSHPKRLITVRGVGYRFVTEEAE